MKTLDLRRQIQGWSNKNFGVFPPFWALKPHDFDSVFHDLYGMCSVPARSEPAKEVESFLFMGVLVVRDRGSIILEKADHDADRANK